MIFTRGWAMAEFVKVARTGEIAPGQGKAVETGGKRIAIFKIDGKFYAIDDTCTHRGGPLSEGMVVGTEVTCPWHGAVFDVTSGAVLGAPAPRDVASYPVRIEGEDIEVEI
jgi:nitrite reductase (NADH) small subunit